jgi:uncharacterized membrane protein YphA (DoxX/SURF4 family)
MTPSNGAAGRGLAIARIGIGAMFIYVFFENYGKGLYSPGGYAELIKWYAENGSAPAFWKPIMLLAASSARIAAPMQAVAELSFGVLLLVGLLTRAAGFAAGAFLASLWVSELGTAWIWELLVPLWTAFAVAIGAGGRTWGLDARLARTNPNSLLW